MIKVHYALQVCDTKENTNHAPRYPSRNRSEISQRSINSLLKSIKWCTEKSDQAIHTIKIFNDQSSDSTLEFINTTIKKYSSDRIIIEMESLIIGGVMNSIRACYEWMSDKGQDIVYQVQDDYLFEPNAIFEMIDVFNQLNIDLDTHAVICPYNQPIYWRIGYRYKSTPRMIVPAAHRYWIQLYDIPCTFMTSVYQFNRHWDLYNLFFSLDPKGKDGGLEDLSLNKMFTEKGVLGVMPVESLALHMQTDLEKDPYIDWKERWDAASQ